MTTEIEYALMAGASYISTRDPINQFPIPQGWTDYFHVPNNPDYPMFTADSGFEAISFTRGTDIVISFAGTYMPDLTGDWVADAALAESWSSAQLTQAAEYYLQVKAANPNATITLTGHSLGGGLAALIGVFFGVETHTFDQAPFAESALPDSATDLFDTNVAVDLLDYLMAQYNNDGSRKYNAESLSRLSDFIQQREDNGGILIPNANLVKNTFVQGEFLSEYFTAYNTIGTNTNSLLNNESENITMGSNLHSQALLTAFLQSEASDNNNGQALNDVTFKLPDLLKMIFDKNLYAHDTDTNKENFLERLVKHEAGAQATGTQAAITADQMVTRFTTDLWKIAQDGGVTLTNANITKTLTAFAMQMYYENPEAFGVNKQLFTDLNVTGGIRFDRTDVAATLGGAKGWNLYFQDYLNELTPEEHQAALMLVPSAVDWFVQAGGGAMNATADENNSFMLGGSGGDVFNTYLRIAV